MPATNGGYFDVVGNVYARSTHIIIDWQGSSPALNENVLLVQYLGSRSYSQLSASGINPTTTLTVIYGDATISVKVVAD